MTTPQNAKMQIGCSRLENWRQIEKRYLAHHLQEDVNRAMAMMDPRAGWPSDIALSFSELAIGCISMNEQERPSFVEIVMVVNHSVIKRREKPK